MMEMIKDDRYKSFLCDITKRIRSTQYEAMRAVNTEMMNLYWQIGKELSEKQSLGWGKSVVETLSKDIQKEFPGIKGFGSRNLWYMVQFYSEYQSNEFLQPLVAEISWAKHLAIMTKCKDVQERRFYILATKKFGWTKDLLINEIDLKAYEKYLFGQSNYEDVLPESVKKQAVLAIKDDYFVGYENLGSEHSEYELEQSLIHNIQQFLAEFGPDVMYAGNQYRLEVAGKEYFVDIMLYHRRLRCFVAIELKIGEFEPEYKGKMEFYLNVINDTIKLSDENPAIGIIICKSKDRTIVEYALKSSNMPIGVATYSLSSNLPEDYVDMLPETSAIEAKISRLIEK